MPSQPFLSLPSLQGFLKNKGVENVSIRDLNIETMDALLSAEKVRQTHAIIDERLNEGPGLLVLRKTLRKFIPGLAGPEK